MATGLTRPYHGALSRKMNFRLKEIVLGLHWDPPAKGEGTQPADLDALCVLFDSDGRVLEIIHPAHPRSADGSIVHTGDSRTGASSWDDERIFVFLDALPDAVSRLDFLVRSATGHPFDEVPGALCHVSDRTSETQWVRIDLTLLAGRVDYRVATLHRGSSGWTIAEEGQSVDDRLPAAVQSLLRTGN